MSGVKELFDREGGSILRWPADAREILKGQPDRFSLSPWPAEPEAVAEAPAVPEAEAPRRGPGRPRKAEG